MKLIKVILAGIITDFALFPLVFRFFPSLNTKEILAFCGIFLFLYDNSVNSNVKLPKGLLQILLFAILVSFIGLISTTFNYTSDYTYTTYVISMIVWCSSSYVAVRAMMWAENGIDFKVISNYIIGVCTIQCLLAIAIHRYDFVMDLVDNLQGYNYAKENERLYGLGCSLDVAGMRFSAALVLISVLLPDCFNNSLKKDILFYLFSTMVLIVLGSMISRTTMIGFAIALLYWIYKTIKNMNDNETHWKRMWSLIGISCVIVVPYVSFLYRHDVSFHEDLRFAFEGFFSLVENGEWRTTSNDRLATMVIFPEQLKTWIIGDGYFNNPLASNDYYIGEGIGDYYMSTDIGYLRFIYYFGLIGTLTFMAYFLVIAKICAFKFKRYSNAFYLLLLLSYVVWTKVSTDNFVIFSFFIMMPISASKYSYKNESIHDIAVR